VTITVHGKIIKTDNEGYLLTPQDWSEEIRLELVKQHKKLAHETFKQENDSKHNLYETFPHGPIGMIAKMAGIPRTAISKEVSGG